MATETGRVVSAPRLARDLHPGAWWLWAMGLAAAATATTNPLLLLVIVGIAAVTVSLRRSDHPWSRSFRLYLAFGLVIVVIRVVFRVLLGGGYGEVVLVHLPTVPLPDWVAGIRLLGPVTLECLLAGLYDGMRLATIVICVGAANSLANPKRLLKSMPPALYEIGTAIVVAVALLPQLADSLRRVRAARQLRGVPGGRLGRLRGVVVPVMEDALERSMSLAAGMDARGYGRAGNLTAGRRRSTGTLMLAGLVGICVGTYALLDQTAPRWLVLPGLVGGAALAAGGFWSAGRRVQRSRYRPDHWRPAEVGVALSGAAVAVGVLGFLRGDALLQPALDAWPTVTGEALVIVLLGTVAAFVSPPPVLAEVPARPLPEVADARAA
ncbi:MAG: cobalt transport protein [Marmoricola sp.]|nr:cobalt transport protein [Marmoricola sp.]